VKWELPTDFGGRVPVGRQGGGESLAEKSFGTDARFYEPPAMFDGSRTGWRQWKVKMEGYMIGINERYQVALQEAERHPRAQALEVPAAYRE
jgi:hypothetical protein